MSETVWLEDVVHTAMHDGADVRLELDEEYGFHIVIDGVAVTDLGGWGLPWETLTYELPEDAVESLGDARGRDD